VIAVPLADGRVEVQVDQAGHDDHPGGVDHLGPGRVPWPGSWPGSVIGTLADGCDPVAVEDHVPAEVHGPVVVHRQDGAVLDHDHCVTAPHI
jgi:hypothetical protein